MRYALIVLLGLVSCADARPKFGLGDFVSVKSGFYRGCHGYAEALKGSAGRYRYLVRLGGCRTYNAPVTHIVVEEAEL